MPEVRLTEHARFNGLSPQREGDRPPLRNREEYDRSQLELDPDTVSGRTLTTYAQYWRFRQARPRFGAHAAPLRRNRAAATGVR